MRLFFTSALLAAVLTASGCSNTPASSSADAKPALLDLTNGVILPTYRASATSAEALQVATKALESAPSQTTLTAAQTAWRAARKIWHQSEAFRFGPVKTKEITSAIDFWPARGDTIDAFINGATPITAASFEALGANARGFQALEYVLFDSAVGDAAVLARLTTDPSAKRRLLYAVTAAAHLAGKTAELYAAWDPARGNFAREITEAGSGAVLFPSGKAAVDQLVNSMIFSVDLVTGTKLGKPYGTKSGGNPLPDQEESPRSDNSLADMLDTLEGARSIYTGAYGGADGKGVGDLVRAKNPALDDRVLAAMDDTKAKISAIPPPFRTAITAQRPAVEAAYQATRLLKNTLSTEVATTLATTLQFNDNDGD
jgi:uncharacterized protein